MAITTTKYEDVFIALLEDVTYQTSTIQFPQELADKVTRITRGKMVNSRFTGKIDFPNLSACYYATENTGQEYGFFEGTKFTQVSIPKLSTLGQNLFYNCASLTGTYLPEAKSYSGRNHFCNCINLISSGVDITRFKKLPGSFYGGCVKLTGILSSDNLVQIGKFTFDNCKAITLVDFPNLSGSGIDAGGQSAQEFCNMDNLSVINIPNYKNVIGIGGSYANYWFLGTCNNLLSANFANAVQFGRVIGIASKLKLIDFRDRVLDTIPTVLTNSFENTASRTYKIAVPDRLYDDWLSTGNWTVYANRIVKASEYAG